MMFNDSIQKSFILSFDSCTSGRKTIDTQLANKNDISSAQNFNSPKHLIVAHQSAARIGVPNKANNMAIFDKLNVRKNSVETHGVRYPEDAVSIDYASNDSLDQYRDLTLFYKEYVVEEDMKNSYPIQVIDVRFQVDDVNLKKINNFRNIEVLLIMLDCFWY